VTNFVFATDGTLRDPVWSREKGGITEYGPLPIIREMQVGVTIFSLWGKTYWSCERRIISPRRG